MFTINLIVQKIHSLYNKGAKSKDARLSDRLVYYSFLEARNTLLKQKIDKGQKISYSSYQTLSCIELIKTNPFECPDCIKTDCLILRSKDRLPRIITTSMGHQIKSLTTLDGNINFEETSFESNKYSSGNKYTANKPSFYLKDDYLYVVNRLYLKAVTIQALFENPINADNFKNICGNFSIPNKNADCKSILDYEFPIDATMLKTVYDFVKQDILSLFLQIPEDRYNDRNDSQRGQIPKNNQNQNDEES